MTQQTIISVGFDGASAPGLLEHDVRDAIREAGGELVACIIGDSYSPRWGREPASWFAVQGGSYDDLRRLVLKAAREQGQDTVAFTRGTLDLASTDETEQETARDSGTAGLDKLKATGRPFCL